MPVVTLPELAEHLNMRQAPSESAKVAELQRMLDAAEERVEAVCGPLAAREVTERIDVTRGQGLTAAWPVLALVSARIAPRYWEPLGTTTAAVTAGLSPDGVLHCATALTGTVLAVLSAGRNPVPASLREALLVIASHLYDTQRAGGSATGQAGATETVVLSGFAVPRRAAELMKPHMSPKVG